MCLYPRLIKNRKYTANKKNGGHVPPLIDPRTEYVPVGCQECIECRKAKAREWQVRLLEDVKTNTNGKFITLTFNNNSIAELLEHETKQTNENGIIEKIKIKELKGYKKDNAIATRAVRLFNERWRKKYKKALRHWLVTELGSKNTQNIHLHGIIWTNENPKEIENLWQYGFVWKGYERNGKIINYVNGQTVNYIIKYINKIDIKHKTYKSKILTSPGIGSSYINNRNSEKNKFNNENTIDTYRTSTGHKISLPIYLRNKIYTDKEKEQLWINKLNKQERWVCGERVDISKGDKEYTELRNWHRKRNTQLGYGTGLHTENQKEYETKMREILIETRIRKKTPSARSNQKGTD